ncbi:MAG: type II toxin-antitoxin system Phd/YefM family antitoxin [Myxococcales bacterium]|nr:type II toxin-antitoxin system Phd/YefM family antitoxin [Myxococcales bacterium]
MTISATELRANLYRLLDRVVQTGEPIEINRGGKIIRLVLEKPADKMNRLEPRTGYLQCDPDELVHLDWSDQWKP